ncbi:MAG: hypothetical protein DWH84_00395 [Planctomycetota bacterium]|nr:MAG: hypothetical protein DWH84_00395 [Planctomycetota bacterium]
MPAPILYCGDTNLDGAASYLAGLITHFGWAFDYVPSHVPMTRELIERPHSLLILSDYPAMQFDDELQEIALKQVESGMGLLMIGGWESFRGLGGDWDVTPLARALPVEIGRDDDRVNFDQPALLWTDTRSPILHGLPWDERPPTVGGMNKVNIKDGGEMLLRCTPFHVTMGHYGEFSFAQQDYLPMLVVGEFKTSRTAAFMSDVAPHWVGGFVDWGPERVKAQAAGASAIEVGSYYAQFWKQLLSWVGRLE